ncbi:MAG: NADH-quinone oxidoreductase subunit NuoH [Planctomycetota bacterium]|jgi:NADH-quinone oxidoreductase subunit H|nr:NADH-quinone oxidoreductase subunit NuoH [Planctomycetota bacterium]
MSEPAVPSALEPASATETVAAPTSAIADWIRDLCGDQEWLAWVVITLIGLGALAALASVSAMVLVWMERKVSAHMQLRLGPMRTGWHGALQPMADGLKLLFKEGLLPRTTDLFSYLLAPFIPMATALLALAVIPFSETWQLADPELGIIYVAALSGMSVFAILIGSWGSNNKYSLLGGMRAAAQALSYEISLLLVLMTAVLMSGETAMQAIVQSQEGYFWNWWLIRAPGVGFIAFIAFIISATAELNRAPFDFAESESELTGGFHTEYAGMAFAMFFLAEYVHLLVAACLGAVLFLGGYLPPVPALAFIPGPVWLLVKAFGLVFLFMWFRWTFPRLRIDQLLNLEWKFLMPVALLNLLAAGALRGWGWL